MQVRNTAKKRETSLSWKLMKKIGEKRKKMLFDNLKIGIKERQKHHIWKEITPSVSSVGVET